MPPAFQGKNSLEPKKKCSWPKNNKTTTMRKQKNYQDIKQLLALWTFSLIKALLLAVGAAAAVNHQKFLFCYCASYLILSCSSSLQHCSKNHSRSGPLTTVGQHTVLFTSLNIWKWKRPAGWELTFKALIISCSGFISKTFLERMKSKEDVSPIDCALISL